MIKATNLRKRYGDHHALSGVDLDVPEGTICGLLGPNGAGKTTIVRILATLLHPDKGEAKVDGLDVVRDAARLRFKIGLAGQHAAVDELLTGHRNLELFGRLYHLPRKVARRRADELLERFELTAAARRPVKTYSGGMRRRLDLAASLIISPPVLFMDEPTTGLDPRSRMDLWDMLRALVAEGTTLLLTTQYLDEADHLADQVVVLNQGRVAAAGSPAQLKKRIGGNRIEVVFRDPADIDTARDVIARTIPEIGPGTPVTVGASSGAGHRARARELVVVDVAARRLSVPVSDGSRSLVRVAGALDSAGIEVEDLSLRQPTLDEVFLAVTAS